MRNVFACVLVAALMAAFSAPASASPVSQLVVFGDSLSDTGNVFNATMGNFPAPPYFEGRFSNGPVWVEHLADQLGIARPAPSTAGGTNFAFGGALSGADVAPDVNSPGMLTQIGAYTAGGGVPSADQLFVVWTGANDFLLVGEDDAAAPVANIVTGLTALADAGATRFLVPNLPQLTALPGASLPPSDFVQTPEDLGSRSADFNALLDLALDQFEAGHSGVELIRFDVAGLLEEFLSDPAAHGFTNVTTPFMVAAPGADPSEYLFWDTVHVTSAAHAIVGQRAAALIPEPAALVVLASLPLLLHRRPGRRAPR